jgi:hypothetical protein
MNGETTGMDGETTGMDGETTGIEVPATCCFSFRAACPHTNLAKSTCTRDKDSQGIPRIPKDSLRSIPSPLPSLSTNYVTIHIHL